MPTANMLASTLPDNIAMSSHEIAELTSKEHKHVLRDIKKMISDLYNIDGPNLDHQQIQGVTVTKDNRNYISCIDLDYSHTITLVTGYDTKARKKVVDRWMALEQKEYTPKPKQPRPRKPSVLTTFKTGYGIAKIRGLDDNQASLCAARYCHTKCGENPLELMGAVSIEAPTNENYLTPTEIGAKIGLSGQKVNQILTAEGYQNRVKRSSTGSDYEPTEKGKDVSRFFDTTRKHGNGSQQQLKWSNRMVAILRPFSPVKEKAS